MLIRLFCLALCLLSTLAAPTAEAKLHLKPEVSTRATVHFLGAASGRYALVADSGAILEPVNLKRAYQSEGMRVKFTAKFLVRPQAMIAGARVVRITSIHALPASAVPLIKPGPTGLPKIPKLP